MKTHETRRTLSKKRQAAKIRLEAWARSLRDLKVKMIEDPAPEDQSKLVFGEAELKKCRLELEAMDKSGQRAWASGKLVGT